MTRAGIPVAIVAPHTTTGIPIHSGISDIASATHCSDGAGHTDIHIITGDTIHIIMVAGMILTHTMVMAPIIQDTMMVITAVITATIITIITTIIIHTV